MLVTNMMAENVERGVTWFAQDVVEVFWSANENENRRLRLSQLNDEGEQLGFGTAGQWSFAWRGMDIEGEGYATIDEARDAAIALAPAYWGRLHYSPDWLF